jgi:hypothetical protein
LRWTVEIPAAAFFREKQPEHAGRYLLQAFAGPPTFGRRFPRRNETQVVTQAFPAPRRWLRTALVGLAIASAAQSAARAHDDLCGCWEGTWKGCTDGLTGIVKAKITKCGPNRYRAVFHGWAFKIMPFRYVSIITAEDDPETGGQKFHVTQKLPIWGCYWMNGCANGCSFFARYHTDDHVGYFKMTKVCCKR